jgi:CDGSH-type Zn-finger protein
MSETIVAQKAPFEIELVAGKNYAWCACGRSAKQPFCDGAHKDTSIRPIVFTAEKSETAWLCGCKRTEKGPHCDGTHNSL